MLFPGSNKCIRIGNSNGVQSRFVGIGHEITSGSTSVSGTNFYGGVNIGAYSQTVGTSIAIGGGQYSGSGGSHSGITKALGIRSISIGYNASVSSGCDSGIAIGNSAETTISNGLAIGNSVLSSSTNPVYLRGGDRYVKITSSSTSWTITSDARDKTDFEKIDNKNALLFINKLSPVTYVMNDRLRYFDDITHEFNETDYLKGTKKNKRRSSGFIAQEVYKTLEDVYETNNFASIVDYSHFDNPDSKEHIFSNEKPELNGLYTMRQAEIIPFLVAAIQQQNKEIEDLKSRLDNIENNQK